MRVAIVTGSSRGLGAALSEELLTHGFHVLGLARTAPSGQLRGGLRFVRCDFADTGAIAAVARPEFEAIVDAKPAAVCLINNAATIDGVGVMGALEPSMIASSLAVNLVAPTLLSNLFCAVFRDEAVERRIVNVSSGAAQSTLAGESLYCVAKAGLEMLTRSLADENASNRLDAISVRPGIIDTAMQTFARSRSQTALPSVGLFKGFHERGELVPPDVVARKIVARLVLAPVESGRTYTYAEL